MGARDRYRGEKQLTTDGVKDYGYATDNAGWTHSEHAIVVWSPDSKMLATFQQDQRKTGEMYTVTPASDILTWKLEIPAGRRQRRDHDRARNHRRGYSKGDAAQDAAGPASLHSVR